MARLLGSVLATLLLSLAATAAPDPCAGFTWDVRAERALFAGDPLDIAAGKAAADAPELVLGRLYSLELRAEPEVSFAAPPGRRTPTEAAYAGLAQLRVPAGGPYRIAIDQAAWVDVLVNGTPIQARGFQGRRGCSAPHKIVEFELPAATPLVLQFSGGVTPAVLVTVTAAPAHAPAGRRMR
jgi:hypothetical protein